MLLLSAFCDCSCPSCLLASLLASFLASLLVCLVPRTELDRDLGKPHGRKRLGAHPRARAADKVAIFLPHLLRCVCVRRCVCVCVCVGKIDDPRDHERRQHGCFCKPMVSGATNSGRAVPGRAGHSGSKRQQWRATRSLAPLPTNRPNNDNNNNTNIHHHHHYCYYY